MQQGSDRELVEYVEYVVSPCQVGNLLDGLPSIEEDGSTMWLRPGTVASQYVARYKGDAVSVYFTTVVGGELVLAGPDEATGSAIFRGADVTVIMGARQRSIR